MLNPLSSPNIPLSRRKARGISNLSTLQLFEIKRNAKVFFDRICLVLFGEIIDFAVARPAGDSIILEKV